MEKLFVKCKKCNGEFLSPIQMDKESFKTARVSGNQTKCPHCGQIITIDKENLYFKKIK